jgi:hypothetical protein
MERALQETSSVRTAVRVGLAAFLLAIPAVAQDQRFDLGVRGVLTAADGEPANDIPGFGVFGRYRWSDRWSLGLAVDQTEYDFEQPARILGLQQDPRLEPIDVVAEATVISAWLQRDYARARTTWFWGVGLGLASIDVPDAKGPLAGSGSFDIQTDADSEIIASLTGGVIRRLGDRWFLEFALRADQHFADWQLKDRISGATGAIDDYLAWGGHLGFGFRF